MSYLPSGDASNAWEPTPGASGANSGNALTTLYYLSDVRGSVLGLMDPEGAIAERYHYDEFGSVMQDEKFDLNYPGPDNLFGYTGLAYDYTSGLNHARARYFDASIGRFISEDTYLGEYNDPQSLNLYTYVSNNPLIYTDPSGHNQIRKEIEYMLNKADKYEKDLTRVFDSIYKDDMNQYRYLYNMAAGKNGANSGEQQWARQQLLNKYDAGQAKVYKNLETALTIVEVAETAVTIGTIAVKGISTIAKGIASLTKTGNTLIRGAVDTSELTANQFKGLKNNGVVKVNSSGSNRPVTGAKNSYYTTANGEHIFVYDGEGKLIYDLSKDRVKAFDINVNPSGKEFY